jgi:hypothetical protein
MGRPVLLSDNLLNPRIYPSHTISASSTATGTSVESLSAGRRIRGQNVGGWFASSLDTLAYFGAAMDQPRAFDTLWVDRDHNLAGESISVRLSDDGFSTYTEIGPLTVPSAPVPMQALYGGSIVQTDEGALLWWLGEQVAHDVRVYIAAMGTGLRPELAGAMIGKSFAPAVAQIKPVTYGNWNLLREVTRSPQAQSAGSEVGRYRSGILHIRAESMEEYATARYPLEELYLSGHGMVLVHDDEQAERAIFTVAPPGQAGWAIPDGRYHPEFEVPYEEPEPVLL